MFRQFHAEARRRKGVAVVLTGGVRTWEPSPIVLADGLCAALLARTADTRDRPAGPYPRGLGMPDL